MELNMEFFTKLKHPKTRRILLTTSLEYLHVYFFFSFFLTFYSTSLNKYYISTFLYLSIHYTNRYKNLLAMLCLGQDTFKVLNDYFFSVFTKDDKHIIPVYKQIFIRGEESDYLKYIELTRELVVREIYNEVYPKLMK